MSGELDEKALAEARSTFAMENSLERAIRAYLAASPSPSEMEVVVFDGVAKRKLDGLLERGWKVSGYALHREGDHGLITTGGFVGWFSVAERNDADARAKLADAAAQVLRLTEENEALRKERTSLIETKREQLERMQRRLDLYEAAISFVRRWAIEKYGNGTSAEERLSAIAHHPFLKDNAL